MTSRPWIRRRADPVLVQQVWNLVESSRTQKQSSAQERIIRSVARELNITEDQVDKLIKDCIADELIEKYNWMVNKGLKAGETGVGYRVPDFAKTYEKDGHDWYCFACHKPGEVVCCSECFRVYHRKCLPDSITDASDFLSNLEDFVCPQCEFQPKCEYSRKQIRKLLEFATHHLKHKPMWKDLMKIGYLDDMGRNDFLVYKYVDLSLLSKKIKDGRYYSLEAFIIDVKILVHDVCIIYGEYSNMADLARVLLREVESEIKEVQLCTDCYINAKAKPSEWISKPCKPPHDLIWARSRGVPFWPAKILEERDDGVEIRFFGMHHERSFVAKDDTTPFDIPYEELGTRRTPAFDRAMAEVRKLQKNMDIGYYTHSSGESDLPPSDDDYSDEMYLSQMRPKQLPVRRTSGVGSVSSGTSITPSIIGSSSSRKRKSTGAGSLASAIRRSSATSSSAGSSATKRRRSGNAIASSVTNTSRRPPIHRTPPSGKQYLIGKKTNKRRVKENGGFDVKLDDSDSDSDDDDDDEDDESTEPQSDGVDSDDDDPFTTPRGRRRNPPSRRPPVRSAPRAGATTGRSRSRVNGGAAAAASAVAEKRGTAPVNSAPVSRRRSTRPSRSGGGASSNASVIGSGVVNSVSAADNVTGSTENSGSLVATKSQPSVAALRRSTRASNSPPAKLRTSSRLRSTGGSAGAGSTAKRKDLSSTESSSSSSSAASEDDDDDDDDDEDDDDEDDDEDDEDESSTSSPADQNAVSRTPDSCVVTSSVDDGSKGSANANASTGASNTHHKVSGGSTAVSGVSGGNSITPPAPPPPPRTACKMMQTLPMSPPKCSCKEKYERQIEELLASANSKHREELEKETLLLKEQAEQNRLRALQEWRDESQNEMTAALERERQSTKNEVEQLVAQHKEAIAMTKRRQWCINCLEEAMYHCCWNTSYCSIKCQQDHWQKEHKRVCRRKR